MRTYASLTLLAIFLVSPTNLLSAQTLQQVTEGSKLVINAETFRTAEQEISSLHLEVGPSHGTLSLDIRKPGVFGYQATHRYIGFDRAIFSAQSENSQQTVLLELEIRVLPTTLPVAGTFTHGGYGAFGLYHQAALYFELCDEWDNDSNHRWANDNNDRWGNDNNRSVLVCEAVPVVGAAPGWFPVYGDWDGDGWHLPSLFDPTSGTLHFLASDEALTELSIETSISIPEARGTWPTAGDWNGNGLDRLLLVDREGTIRVVESNRFERLRVNRWTHTIPVPTHEAFPWPTLWNRNRDTNHESVGVINQATRTAFWISNSGRIFVEGSAHVQAPQGHKIPFAAEPAILGGHPEVLSLELRDIGTSAFLFVSSWWHQPQPSTLPLKFLHEPPGI